VTIPGSGFGEQKACAVARSKPASFKAAREQDRAEIGEAPAEVPADTASGSTRNGLMLLRRFYYDLKPFLPRRLRTAARRFQAARVLRRSGAVWPICESAGAQPDGWTGWPEGKRFAVVLTHDVEGPEGFEKCRKLMELDMRCGFRSAFNFVPEGDYSPAATFRDELRGNGFEVGVHDLRHDGKLYRDRESFRRQAAEINRYLKAWGAVGFRSAYMLHQLDWTHDLEVLYDASTFDSDPFEPQPDGCNTIFPFWVGGQNGDGFVEIPYTLPQDSTLFLYLREPTWEIWRRKLDWVASHGGMAHLTVHPDYMRFAGDSATDMTYPAERFSEFLDYVRTNYVDQYWQPLPRQIAKFFLERQRTSTESQPPATGGQS
jgi:hypothetical protein